MTGTGRKLYQQIAKIIADGIGEGRYPRGTRLPGERDLAEELKVSRPTIREAMIALEIRGLVEARHGSGIFVKQRPPEHEEVRELDVGAFELIEARRLFEGEAAALAALAIAPDMLGRLENLLVQMEAFLPDSPEVYQCDRAFHLGVAEATGNTLILSTVETLWNVRERSPLCVHMFAQARQQGVNARIEEHRAIFDALRAGDPDQARAAMRDHLARVTDDLLVATELELVERAREEAKSRRQMVARRVA